jgi:hypothetical protein
MEGRGIVERVGVEREGIGLVDFVERRAHAICAAVCRLHRRHSSLSNETGGLRRNASRPRPAKPHEAERREAREQHCQVKCSGIEEVTDKVSAKL